MTPADRALLKFADDRIRVKVEGGTLMLPPTVGANFRSARGGLKGTPSQNKRLVNRIVSQMEGRKSGKVKSKFGDPYHVVLPGEKRSWDRNNVQDRATQAGAAAGFAVGASSKKTFNPKQLLGKKFAKRLGGVGGRVASGILGAASTATVASMPRTLAPKWFAKKQQQQPGPQKHASVDYDAAWKHGQMFAQMVMTEIELQALEALDSKG